jgi:hypothetical protein
MRTTGLLGVAAVAVLLAGCANPDATPPHGASPSPASPGEPAAPFPPLPSRQASAAPQPKAAGAVERFAALYTNWNYRTLAARQRTLAAVAVGPARLWARQLAASARQQALAGAQVWNRGRVIALARERDRLGWWVLVTREQTGGDGEYAGLPERDHVTLVRATALHGGWAVSEWSPQN